MQLLKIGRAISAGAVGRMTLGVVMLSGALGARAFGQQDVHATLIPAATRMAAPNFELPGAAGPSVQLSEYKGKVVLLNFWATQCGGCVREVPYFVEMQGEFKGQGFTVVGLSMDMWYEGQKSADMAWGMVKPFVAEHKMDYPILMGDSSLFAAYGLKALPVTYLIDKAGRTAAVYVGVVSKDDVEANVKMLVAEH
jgi:peroxiredoxin